MKNISPLTIANHTFKSRLFLGTGKVPSINLLGDILTESGSELVTVALRRLTLTENNSKEAATQSKNMLEAVKKPGVIVMPNTSGARTAKEAVLAAKLGREALETNWIKVEIHPDVRYLMPDPVETFLACAELVKDGFIVMPYIHADPALCKRLEEIGTASIMPLAAPIGSNRGLEMRAMLEIIIEQAQIPVVIDAGIGAPSQATAAIEMGADAVLVNTAIASAEDPVLMAKAFKEAVTVGEIARAAGIGPKSWTANATSPLTEFLEL